VRIAGRRCCTRQSVQQAGYRIRIATHSLSAAGCGNSTLGARLYEAGYANVS